MPRAVASRQAIVAQLQPWLLSCNRRAPRPVLWFKASQVSKEDVNESPSYALARLLLAGRQMKAPSATTAEQGSAATRGASLRAHR
jgi:hypothetical protein